MEFITSCGFMTFVYSVRSLILLLKTIKCISLINVWFLIETYKKRFGLFLHTLHVFKKHISLFSKIQFLNGDDALCLLGSIFIFLLTGLRIYTGEYKAQGPTLCPTEGRALRGPRALYSPV